MKKMAILILLAFVCCACGSNCAKTKRYWSKHKCVNNTRIINNQILIKYEVYSNRRLPN